MIKTSLALLLAGFASPLLADQILVLSGGGSPMSNHYSQYRQTKTLFDDLATRFPRSNPEVMFGAGNREGADPVLADAHRSVNVDGLDFETQIPGFIKNNQPATQASVESYFISPQITGMKSTENFFLFVSDHGMPYTQNDGTLDLTFENNCIDLWSFKADLATGMLSMGGAQQRCLSKEKLRTHFDKNVGSGKVVFAMSQCYSGGFHKMSVSKAGNFPKANPRICGFTAVPEDTTASGCTADVDGPSYQGYERSFTEQLTGVDVVNGTQLRAPRTSMKEAHEEASVEDVTKDIPLSTSDFYLWQWAQTISEAGFVPRSTALTAVDAAATVASVKIGDPTSSGDLLYTAKEQYFLRVQNKLVSLHPELEETLTGNLDKLKAMEQAISLSMATSEGTLQTVSNSGDQIIASLMRQWTEYVRSGKSTLSDEEKQIELSVFGPSQNMAMALIHMSVKAVTKPEMASAISKYKAKRLSLAKDWAAKNKRKDLQLLPAKINRYTKRVEDLAKSLDAEVKIHGHIRRILIYRQILGAWAALEKMNDREALAELKGLLECEATPL